MTKREARRLVLAEDTCRAFRTVIGTPNYRQTPEQWALVVRYLSAWMNIGPRKYDPPTARIRKTY